MKRDLFGEVSIDPIVKRAREIARTRRPLPGQLRTNGTEEVSRGYVVYDDFKGYIQQQVLAERSEVQVKREILNILRDARWKHKPIPHGKTLFYEPIEEAEE